MSEPLKGNHAVDPLRKAYQSIETEAKEIAGAILPFLQS